MPKMMFSLCNKSLVSFKTLIECPQFLEAIYKFSDAQFNAYPFSIQAMSFETEIKAYVLPSPTNLRF